VAAAGEIWAKQSRQLLKGNVFMREFKMEKLIHRVCVNNECSLGILKHYFRDVSLCKTEQLQIADQFSILEVHFNHFSTTISFR
jgi:hypothetical protein